MTIRMCFKLKLQQLYSLTRQALDDYEMIKPGDNIAIGISGGKDSLALLYSLAGLRKFYPVKFSIHAVTVDLGFDNLNLEDIQQICDSLEVPYTIIRTEIGRIVFDDRKEPNPCSLCAKMRKGALNTKMKELGCNKIAYAHHRDDVLITMLMSLFYEGRFHTFCPVTFLDKTDLQVIRPFIYIPEAKIKGFINKYRIPVVKSPCPADGNTKRKYISDLLQQLNRENPGIKDRMFTAILNSNMEGWSDIIGKNNTKLS